jgi:hypothetical protein
MWVGCNSGRLVMRRLDRNFFVGEVDGMRDVDSQAACHAMEIGRLPGSSKRLASSPTTWRKQHVNGLIKVKYVYRKSSAGRLPSC